MSKFKNLLIYLSTCLFIIGGCNLVSNNETSFYKTFSEDWDLDVIPLIEPFRLASIDRGESWVLDGDSIVFHSTENTIGMGRVKRFGISKNYFFGQNESDWFFFDTKTRLYEGYKTGNELINCLNSFNIPITPIKSCREYQDDISKNGRCYWFPPPGQKYNEKLELKPNDTIDLYAFGNDIKNAGFKAPASIKQQNNRIYFFKLNIDDKNNDLLYFGINWESFILIKDETIVPIFINSDNFDITLYTPFPVAQQKGIMEDNRIHIKRILEIKKEI